MRSLELIRSFVDRPEARVRRNAATALAAIDSAAARRASQRLLAKLALSDEDASVRARAQDEIQRLGAGGRDAMLYCVETLTQDSDPTTRRANLVLNKLKSLGVATPRPSGSYLERWRSASRLRRKLAAAEQDPWFHVRMARFGLFGGLTAACLMAFLLSYLHPPISLAVYVTVFATTSVLAPIATVWLNQSACPVTSFFDRSMASAVEIARFAFSPLSILFSLVLALGVSGLWSFAGGASRTRALALSASVLICFLVILMAVRLGGFLVELAVRRPFPWLPLPGLQSLATGLFAGGALTVYLWLVVRIWPRTDVASLAAWIWLTVLPVFFASGYGLARLQTRAIHLSILGRSVTAAVGIVVIVVLIGVGTGALSGVPIAVEGQPRDIEVWFDAVPDSLWFQVGFPQFVAARLELEERSPPSVLRLLQDGQVLAEGEEFEVELDPGRYRLEAIEPGAPAESISRDQMAAHWTTIARLARKVLPPDKEMVLAETAVRVNYTLNSQPKKATRDAYLNLGWDQLEAGLVAEALLALERAADFDPVLRRSAAFWEQACWFSSVQGLSVSDKVLEICERATRTAPELASAWQSLALARGLTDDLDGALEALLEIEELEADHVPQTVRDWLEKLKREEDPFTLGEVLKLRSERTPDRRLGTIPAAQSED